MENGEFIFLLGILEVLLGFFFLVLSGAIYFFDVFKFKLGRNRLIIVIILMFFGWLLFIYGLLQLIENYTFILS